MAREGALCKKNAHRYPCSILSECCALWAAWLGLSVHTCSGKLGASLAWPPPEQGSTSHQQGLRRATLPNSVVRESCRWARESPLPAKMGRGNMPVWRGNPAVGRGNHRCLQKNGAREHACVARESCRCARESPLPAKNGPREPHPVWAFKIIEPNGVGLGTCACKCPI